MERYLPGPTVGYTSQYQRRSLPYQQPWASRESAPRVPALVPSHGVSWISTFVNEMHRIAQLPPNWDTYGATPPNQRASLAAYELLQQLWEDGREPVRIAPTSEEGFIVWLSENDVEISIECLNRGTICVESTDVAEPIETEDSDAGIAQALGFVLDRRTTSSQNVPRVPSHYLDVSAA